MPTTRAPACSVTPSSGAITMTSCPSSVNRSTAWRRRVTTPSTQGRKVSVATALFTGPRSLPGDGGHVLPTLAPVGVAHSDLDDLAPELGEPLVGVAQARHHAVAGGQEGRRDARDLHGTGLTSR